MNHLPQPLRLSRAFLGAALALLAPGAAPADMLYKIQPILKLGDQIGDITTNPQGDIEVGALNDNGQIAFVTENAARGAGEIVVQYSGGQLTPIMVTGRTAPGGTWSTPGSAYSPVTMNQRGDIAFTADITIGRRTAPGTFLWDFTAQKTTAVALGGVPTLGNLTFLAGGYNNPAINDSGEIAFPAVVKNAAGEVLPGLFFLGQDQQLKSVVLSGQELPGGGTVDPTYLTYLPTLNDAGAVAFLAERQKELPSAYLWGNGALMPVAVVGAEAPGGGTIIEVGAALVNNKNPSVLVAALVGTSNTFGLYRFAGGQLTPVLVPGQDMPGGGKFRSLLAPTGLFPVYAISLANDAGQHAFLAVVTDAGTTVTGAYLLDPDGKMSPILKSRTSTDLGPITAVGPPSGQPSSGVALNNKGQVALPVKIGTGPATLVLLTPTAP